MIDIDLRWVERETAIWDQESGKGSMKKIPVLQWRKKVPTDAHNAEWTEWQDVRAEDE